MPAKTSDNPFRNKPQLREKALTFRVTPAEHDAIISAVGTKRGAIRDLIREGIAIAIERRQRGKQ